MEQAKEELPNLTNNFDDNLAVLQTSKSNESPWENFDANLKKGRCLMRLLSSFMLSNPSPHALMTL